MVSCSGGVPPPSPCRAPHLPRSAAGVVRRYQSGVSALTVRQADGDAAATGRAAVQAVASDRQAERDAATLTMALNGALAGSSMRQKIQALGLNPVGNNFYVGKKRVERALGVLTTATEMPVLQEVVAE